MCVGLSNFIWLPLMGAVSDRIGRKPLLLAATVLALVTAYPMLSWLVAEPSFARLLEVELWLSFLYGSYNGAMVVALTEIMPADVRTTGFSLAYSLATATSAASPRRSAPGLSTPSTTRPRRESGSVVRRPWACSPPWCCSARAPVRGKGRWPLGSETLCDVLPQRGFGRH